MITVHYHPIDSDSTISSAETLTDWFIAQFGENMQLPEGLRITFGGVSAEHDVTDEISCGDPNSHLTRLTGEYHIVEIPGTASVLVPLVISLVISVAAVLLTPKPQAPSAANRRQDSSTNQLGNRTNDSRPGERFQDVRGFEPSVYADLLMEPFRRFENNRESEYVYGTATTGKAEIIDPRDGVSLLRNINDADFNVYWPGTYPNGSDVPVDVIGSIIDFPVVAATRSRNITGQQLAPPNQLEVAPLTYIAYSDGTVSATGQPDEFDFRNLYDEGDTVTLAGWISWEYAGEKDWGSPSDEDEYSSYIKHDLSGDYILTEVNESSIKVVPTPNWAFFGGGYTLRTFAYRRVVLGPSIGLYYLGANPPHVPSLWVKESYLPSVQGIFDGSVGPFRIPDGSTSGWVNLLAQNGIRKSGSTDYSYSATFRFTLYELDDNGIRTGNLTPLPNLTLSSNPVLTTDQVGKTQDFEIPYLRCEIVGRRISNTDKGFEGTVIDEVKWAGLYTVEPTETIAPEGVTTVYAKIVQTPSALAVQERKLNFGVKRYERSYLGSGQLSTTEDTPSDEFADAVVGLALDPYVGRNVTLEQLNIDQLYAVQEEIVSYFGTRDAVKFGYSFSTTDMTFEDHLSLVAEAVFCRVFRIGNTYEFRFKRPRAKGETALVLNHRCKYIGTDKRERKFTDYERKGYDGLVATYKSKETLAFETIRIPEGTFPANPKEIELSGVTVEQVAKWHAYREWAAIKYRRVFHETEAHSLARGVVPGDRITMANDTLTRSLNGQVLEQQGLELRLANGIRLEDGVTYSITLLYKSGTVENILCTKGSIGEQWVSLFALPSEELYTGHLEWLTMYNLYESVEADKDDMLVESMTVSIKNGQERVKVQAVNYDVRYWEGDPQVVSTGSYSTAFNDSFDKGYNVS